MCIIALFVGCKKDEATPELVQKNPLEGKWNLIKYEEKTGTVWTSYPLDPWEVDDKIIFTATTCTFDFGTNTDKGGQKNFTLTYSYDATSKKLTLQNGWTYTGAIGTELVFTGSSGETRITYKK